MSKFCQFLHFLQIDVQVYWLNTYKLNFSYYDNWIGLLIFQVTNSITLLANIRSNCTPIHFHLLAQHLCTLRLFWSEFCCIFMISEHPGYEHSRTPFCSFSTLLNDSQRNFLVIIAELSSQCSRWGNYKYFSLPGWKPLVHIVIIRLNVSLCAKVFVLIYEWLFLIKNGKWKITVRPITL